jgi:hypothetical protein
VTTNICKCSFCSILAGSTSFFADSPAALTEAIGNSAAFTVFAGALSLVANTQTAQAGASSMAVAAGASAVPALVNTLTTPGIKTDTIAADINGTVSEASLKTLFSDVAASLGAGKLTAAQFADLKTIAANLNNGISASAYVTYIANALVNGNAANATWTGGGGTAVALGNLGVGSSATQVNELVGKWFVGTDLPNSTVIMSGSQTFAVSYTTKSAPVFESTGPSMNDIDQGALGDCYLLSSLAEVAYQNPTAISSMITDNGNNTYGVRFYYNGAAEYVTVNNALANGGSVFNAGTYMWASLVEKAFAQFQAINLDTGNTVDYGNSWSTIGNGGWPDNALEAITGASSLTDYYANGATWYGETFNASLAATSTAPGLSSASVLSALVGDLIQGFDLILCSWTNAYDIDGRQTLVADHAMSIYGYDTHTSMLEIRNPWGTAPSGQYWDTTFEVSLQTLLVDGDYISVANAAASAPPVAPATLSIAAASAVQLTGAPGTTTPFTFTVTRDGNTAIAASAIWTVTGTGANAADAADFVATALPTGTVAFAAGQTSAVISVNVAGDSTIEPDEGFAVTLSGPGANTSIATASASGTIQNSSDQISIVATSAVKAAAASGTTPFTFTVTRVGYTAAAQTVAWAVTGTGTSASTADAADFVGNTLPKGTVGFAAGQTSAVVTVNVAADATPEPNENFSVTLSNPSGNATLGTASAAGTILSNIPPVTPATLSIAAASAVKLEGAAGTSTPFTFTVSRAGNTAIASSAAWTVTGTGANAADASDFVGNALPTGTVSFAAGQTSQVVTVNVAGDSTIEPDEGFAITLSSPSANTSIGIASAGGTVMNSADKISIAAASASKSAGTSGSTPFTFTVSRTGFTALAQTVNWTVAGTGSSPADAADFLGNAMPTGTVTFAAGATAATIAINVAGNPTPEATENFAVTLAGPSGNATLGTASATGSILALPPAGGMHINLLWDSSVSTAPGGFTTAVQTAATLLQNTFKDNITVNIAVGWGEISGAKITQSGVAEGGPNRGAWVTYANLKADLAAHATSADDLSAVAALPASLDPNGTGNIVVWSAQEKALGLIAGNGTAVDGSIGFSTDFPSSIWVGAALHEITHAMGRTSGYTPYGIEDLMRYSGPGVHAFAGGRSEYFSVDNGATRIANFATSSDFGDWASDSLTVNDPYNAFLSSGANALTSADIRVMDAIGFTKTVPGATIAASAGLTAPSMAFADPTGTGSGSAISGSADITAFQYSLGQRAADRNIAGSLGANAPEIAASVPSLGMFANDPNQNLGLLADPYGTHTFAA